MGKYSSHKTYINDMGQEVPSATTILSILNKPHLQRWANAMGFKRIKTEDVLKEASEKGTLTHECIETYLRKYTLGEDKRFILGEESLKYKETIMKRMNGFIKWVEQQSSLKPKLLEEELVDDTFAGTVDYFGDVSGLNCVVDFKTSKSIYGSMFLQMAGYVYILEKRGEVVDGAGILHVTEDKSTFHFKTREELQPYIETFLILVKVFHSWYDLSESEGWGSILG